MLYLFDIDGTILLSGGAGSRALNRVFEARHGVAGAMDTIDPSGKTDPIIVAEMFALALGRPPSNDEVEALLTAYVPELTAELAVSPRFRLMPAVVTALDFLAAEARVVLGLATGNIAAAAQAKLERAGLWQRFGFGGYGSDHADRGELVAVAIARARAHAGREFEKREIVVVGDTPLDVAAARQNQVRVVAVATGGHGRAELEACAPDAVLDTLAELPAWHG